jgi:hypothetical protein
MEERELLLFSDTPELQPSRSIITGAEKDYALCRMMTLYGLRGRVQFPGANPVSIEWSDMPRLNQCTFFAGLKTDGCRYLLLLHVYEGEPRAVMINRALICWEVEVWAPYSYFENETLLDGELTWERVSNGLRQLYLVFDAVHIRESLREKPFMERLNRVHRHILSNLPAGLTQDSSDVEQLIVDEDKMFLASTEMRMSPKGFVAIDQLLSLWEARGSVAHRNDGLVLVSDRPLQTGTDRWIFKWKPVESITVDVEYVVSSRRVRVRERGKDVALSHVTLEGARRSVHIEENQLLDFARHGATDGTRVLECLCRLEAKTVTLLPVRHRTDKTRANEMSTVVATMRNVLQSITAADIASVA